MAPADTQYVFVSVPTRENHKGLFAAGRFFANGKSGPHQVTGDELKLLQANPRIAVQLATPEEVASGAPAEPQTSAPGLTAEEKELLESFRSAKAQKVEVTLVRIAELDQAHSRAAELEAEAKKANDRAREIDAQSKATGAELQTARSRIAELEAQLKTAQDSKKK